MTVELLQDYSNYNVFSAVFKISDKCNLGCSYCYRENAKENPKISHMPNQVVDRTLNSLLEYQNWFYKSHGWSINPSLYFIWHGGEPLIVGIKKFQEILDIQKKYETKGLVITNCIQTNGTLIDENWINLFKKEKFIVGISVDGPEEVHNQYRTYRNGTGSFEEVYNGIEMLKKHNYNWSAISVINKESIDKEEEIFNFFKHEKPVQVDFIPAFFYDTEISLHPEDYSKFMIKMFDLWVSENKKNFDIRFFKDILYLLGYNTSKKKSIVCELSGKCHRNIAVSTNGDIYTCECLNTDPANKIGNICRESFREMINKEPFIQLTESTNNYSTECKSCDVFFVCKAGCYNRRLPTKEKEPRLDFYCGARKQIILHIMQWMQDHQLVNTIKL